MSSDRMHQIERLFARAAELPTQDRSAFLERECGDAETRREVESLLAHLEKAGAFLDEPHALATRGESSGAGLAGVFDIEAIPAGMRVGAYTVKSVLGSGGMGVVYLAQQDRPGRTVALKLIRPSIAGARTLKRFEREAELLGRLQHEGIAQIFEAGTVQLGAGGGGGVGGGGGSRTLAFIAMEYVDGPTLTDFASIEKLSVERRLRLMVGVCEAIEHAHQRGVIHRDLKPGNILVNSRGQAKVLDFGIAMSEEAEMMTVVTATSNQLVGTLPYMSPEQLSGAGARADVRTDVYALGVILYRLLAGRLPYQPQEWSVGALLRCVETTPPMPLSAIEKGLKGDPETIVSKAMETDPARRYPSAGALAADLQRYLAGEPIEARRDSSLYVLNKSLRRYRGMLALAGCAAAALLVLGVYALLQAQRANERARDAARLQVAAQASAERAEAQRTRADDAAAGLAKELQRATIERGRLTGLSGGLRRAEQVLWPEFLANPKNASAKWALWELYMREPCLLTVTSSARALGRVGMSRDGTLIATSSRDSSIEIWSVRTGERLHSVPLTQPLRSDMAFSPDGKLLAGCGRDHVMVVSTATGAVVARVEIGAEIEDASVSFSPDGSRLAVSSRALNGMLALIDRSTWEVVKVARDLVGVREVRFDPTGTRLGVCRLGGMLQILSAATLEVEREIWVPGRAGRSFSFSSDGRRVAIGCIDRLVRVADVGTGQIVATLRNPSHTFADVKYTNDGSSLLVQGWWSVDFFDAETFQLQDQIAGHAASQQALAVAEESPIFASLDDDGVVRVWELTPASGRRVLQSRAHGEGKGWIAQSVFCGGDRLVAALTGGVDEEPLLEVFEAGGVAGWGGDSAGQSIRCIPLFGDEPAATPEGGPNRVDEIKAVPGTTVVLVSYNRGSVQAIDVSTGARLWLHRRLSNVGLSLATSADGKMVYVGEIRGKIHRFETASGAALKPINPGSSRMMVLRPLRDGTRMIYRQATAMGVVVYDMAQQRDLARFDALPSPWMVQQSPDEELIAVGTWTGAVQIVRTRTGESVRRWEAHDQIVTALAFSPDGAILASGSASGDLKLWDVASGEPLVTLGEQGGSVSSVEFSQDGRRLLSTGDGGVTAIYDLRRYDRHVAGNLERGLELSAAAGREVDPATIAALRAWARSVLSEEVPTDPAGVPPGVLAETRSGVAEFGGGGSTMVDQRPPDGP